MKCCKCEKDAEWQIGSYTPFQKYPPTFWCDDCVPAWVLKSYAEQRGRDEITRHRLHEIDALKEEVER